MNFKFLICNNCDKDKEDSILSFEDKVLKDFFKNNNTDINIKSILSSSDNNIAANNNLEIIEYPYNYNNSQDDYNNEIPSFIPSPEKSNDLIKKTLNKEDSFYETIKPPKLYNESKNEFKDIKEPKERKENFMNSSSHIKQHSKESLSLIQYEDSIVQNKALLTKYYSNFHKGLNNYNNNIIINNEINKDNINEKKNDIINKNNNMDNFNNNETNKINKNNDNKKIKKYNNINNNKNNKNNNNETNKNNNSNETNKSITNNKNYNKKTSNKINNNIKSFDSNNIKINISKKVENNNKNNINNLMGLKIDYPCPDNDIEFKTSNLFNLGSPKKIIKKKESVSIKKIKVTKKLINTCMSKKISKNYILNNNLEKNKIKKPKAKHYSDFELFINNNKNFIFNIKNGFLSSEKIKKKTIKVNTKKFSFKKKVINNSKDSLNHFKKIRPQRTIENKSSKNKILNNKSNYEKKFIELSKNRERFLSQNFFGDILLNSSNHRNTYSNISNLNNSEIYKTKNKSQYSSNSYQNPFIAIYNRKKKSYSNIKIY